MTGKSVCFSPLMQLFYLFIIVVTVTVTVFIACLDLISNQIFTRGRKAQPFFDQLREFDFFRACSSESSDKSGNKDSDLSLTLSDDGDDDHSSEVPLPMDDYDDVNIKTPTSASAPFSASLPRKDGKKQGQ